MVGKQIPNVLFLQVQCNLKRGNRLFEVLHLGCPNNGRCYKVFMQHPCQTTSGCLEGRLSV